MIFTIHTQRTPDRVVRMGFPDQIIPVEPDATANKAENTVVAPKVITRKQTREALGMADKSDKEKMEDAGTETIRKDDAGTQGAIGSHGVNAPAQSKNPESGEDVKIGNKGGKE